MYLEDILELPDLPDGDDDAWSHHHSTGFDLRFTKSMIHRVFLAQKVKKNILELGGYS